MDTIKLIESKQQTANFNDLFKGIVNQANSLLSARLMLVLGISKNVFHSDIYRNLVEEVLDFQKYELDVINNKFSENVNPIYGVNERTIDHLLAEVHCKPYFQNGSFDHNKVNEHHIIANMKKNGGFGINSSGKIEIAVNNYRESFVNRNNTNVRKNSGYILKGADNLINTIPITITRHNKGLNTRYPGNFFPHLQVLAECEFIGLGLNNIYTQGNKSFNEIKKISKYIFEDLYKEESYEFRNEVLVKK